MIIELFGPPCAGKTTFANALAGRLRELGRAVELILSYRPAESAGPPALTQESALPAPLVGSMRRLSRVAIESICIVRYAFRNRHAVGTTTYLLRLLPPRNLLWSIRLSQYILRLFRARERTSQVQHAVLFDQGFVQAICSLVLLGPPSDRQRVIRALDAVPKPDLAILLSAPTPVLLTRFGERLRQQSRLERSLELGRDDNLSSIAITDELYTLLCESGRSVRRIDSSDQQTLATAVDRIAEEVIARLGAAWTPEDRKLEAGREENQHG